MRCNITIFLLLLFILGGKNAVGGDSLMFRVLAIERQMMTADSDSLKTLLLMKKARLYKEAGKYDEAFSSLQRVEQTDPGAVIKDSLHYEKAFNLFMLGSFPAALQELWSMRDIRGYGDACVMLYLMVLLEDQQWNEFEQQYLRSSLEMGVDTSGFLASFKPPRLLDPDRYDRLAKIPGLGLGLIESGYTGRGLTSASLQIVMTGFGVWQIATGYYFTGVFSGLLPARRFYNGGKNLTASMVARTNEKRIADAKRVGYSFISKLK